MRKSVTMKTVTRVLRTYLCMNQTEFSKFVGVTQPDLCELERETEPFGKMDKYIRIAKKLHISVDSLLYNDFRKIPDSFFNHFPPPSRTKTFSSGLHKQGYAGEDLILQRERDRLSSRYPNLAQLVLPISRIGIPSPGYDILSFDDEGTPFAIEVKTTLYDTKSFLLTPNELSAAQILTKAGQAYMITLIQNFGSYDQEILDLSFSEVQESYKAQPYSFQFTPKEETHTITGLAYHRRLQGIPQNELAAQMGLHPSKLSLAEATGRMSAPNFLLASKLLDVPVDNLLKTYRHAPEEPPLL